MRNLISGIVGVILGSLCLLSSLLQGGPHGEGGYFAGQVCALVLGGLFFFGGIVYLVLGIMNVQADSKKQKRRARDDEDRPRKKRRSPDDNDDDEDRGRKKRRSRDDDDD